AIALQTAWNTPFPLRDPGFVTAYSDALRSILTTLGQAQVTPAAAIRGNILGVNSFTSLAASATNATVYHPFDVCCINVDSFSLQSNNYIVPIDVNGPSLQRQLGNASGWLVRVVKLPANFD